MIRLRTSQVKQHDLGDFESMEVTLVPEVMAMVVESMAILAEVDDTPVEQAILEFYHDQSSTAEIVSWLMIARTYREMADSFQGREAKLGLFKRLIKVSVGADNDGSTVQIMQRVSNAVANEILKVARARGNTVWCRKSDGSPFQKL